MSENKDSITKRLIEYSGISEGMRVLDLGCGKGDVSFLLADKVGQGGAVLGVDRNPKAIELAKSRVESENKSNISFMEIELSGSLSELGVFDAVIARRVLMYLPDPSMVLKKVINLLKPNGIVAFQEIDSTVSSSQITSHPLHEKATSWVWDTIKSEGANISMGFTLPSLLKESDITISGVRAEANIQGQQSHAPLSDVVQAIVPRIIHHGVATKEQIDLSTLENRLKDELSDGSVFIGDMSFCIWGRKTS